MQRLGFVAVALFLVACQKDQPTEQPASSAEPSAKGAPAVVSAPPPVIASAPVTSAEPSASAPAAPPVNVTSPAKQQRCLDAARACSKALLASDFDKIVECMPKQAVGLGGGREQVISDMMKGRAQQNRDGVAFQAAEVQPPREIVSSGGQLFAVLPQRVTMSVPKGRVVQDTFLLGVSSDDGATWKFVDGSSLTQKTVGRLFPNFPSTLALPTVQEPRTQAHR